MKPRDARPISPPIELSGVWQMDSVEQADQLLGGQLEGHIYRRDGHPNAKTLGDILREMHSADQAIVTAQGMSALSAACLALLKPGDLVLLGQPLYGKTSYLVKSELSRWGILTEDVLATDIAAWATAIQKAPRLILVETIGNPRLDVPDLEVICSLAHQNADTLVLVDNTFATPVLCQPLRLGADLVMESLSKFVCGHGDVMLGLLCGTDRTWDRIRGVVSAFGLASSPLDCWLTQRGLETLSVRMTHAANSAMAIAQRLVNEFQLEVDYPGLPDHPSHATAIKQLPAGCFGNMLTLHLRGDNRKANQFISAVKDTIPFCPSLGDTRTTLSHPVSTSHRSYSAQQLQTLGIDGGTLRFSFGLEPVETLWEAFRKGLASL
jgi:cystathionine beta-lyase/cystathionine gamma-synthase